MQLTSGIHPRRNKAYCSRPAGATHSNAGRTLSLITPGVEWTTDDKAGRTPNLYATGPWPRGIGTTCSVNLYLNQQQPQLTENLRD